MIIAGILLLKGNKRAILALAISSVFYFLGGIAPILPKYGLRTFSVIMEAFYASIGVRLGLVIVAAILLDQEPAANKPLKAPPDVGPP